MMKNKNIQFIFLFLIAFSFLNSEEQKLFTIKVEPNEIHSNSKFNLYIYTKVKDEANLPKIKNEKFVIDIIIPKDGENKLIDLGSASELKWIKVIDGEYKMLIATPKIKGKGKSGVTTSFNYSLDGKVDLRFEDSIEFELK